MMWPTKTLLSLCFILVGLLLLLGWERNRLFQRATPREQDAFPQVVHLSPPMKAITYLILLGGTWLLMFGIVFYFSTPITLIFWKMILAMGLPLIVSFFIILSLQSVLSLMRRYKQLPNFSLIDLSVFWTAGLISTVEVNFLYWMKEITVYFNFPFLVFVGCYTLLIFGIASYISTYHKPLSKNNEFIYVALLDSGLVVLSATLSLVIILIVTYQKFV